MTILEKWEERLESNDRNWYGYGVAKNIYDEVIEDVKFLEARIALLEAKLQDEYQESMAESEGMGLR